MFVFLVMRRAQSIHAFIFVLAHFLFEGVLYWGLLFLMISHSPFFSGFAFVDEQEKHGGILLQHHGEADVCAAPDECRAAKGTSMPPDATRAIALYRLVGDSVSNVPWVLWYAQYFIDYDVIDLMNFRFEASERIELEVKKATKTITCHAVELYVYDVAVAVPSGDGEKKKTLPCTQMQFVADDESVTFHFAEALPVGATVTLSLRFHGFLNDKLRGFYRTQYELENETRTLAVTQFEACDARRAFVCWDEPAIKARFEISMVTDANLTALSNMHVVQTQVRPKKNANLRKLTRKDSPTEKYWKFAETPIMSTYIVAMVVGEFDVLTDISDEGIIVNVYAAPGVAERGRFSLGVAVRALSFFSKQFGIPYPLKKLDMVAIPDFLGAMENWGLVTYTETYLLVDEKLTSQEIKVDTARTVCHELSHQWFGNLVTMDWWTGLWLNEGFAQYMEFDAVNALFPEWKVWETFVQEVLMASAFKKDSMLTSHPIEVEVHHPKEVDEIFDTISYNKGASVVRMLSEFLGRDVFYQGVHNYLVKFSYKNTKTEDLWEALEEASGVKITKMASSWTQQMGFPLVTLDQSSDGRLVLKQERFFSDFDMKKDDASLWDVPLTLITSEEPNDVKRIGIWDAKTAVGPTTQVTPYVAREEINERVRSVVPAGSTWVKLNPNQASFYLVNYPPAMWKQLQAPVKALTLNAVDRVSLISSVYTLASAGVLPVSDALDFTAAYVNEPDHLCWKQISSSLAKYASLFGDEPFYPQFQKFVRELFSSVMNRLTWEPTEEDKENSSTGNFRALTIARLGAAGDKAILDEAHKRFKLYIGGDRSALSADLRGVVFNIHAKYTAVGAKESREVVKELRELYESSDFAEEKEDCLRAMGLVPDLDVKREVLDWGLGGAVKAQEMSRLMSGVATGQAGVRLAWEYVTSHYDAISARLSPMMLGTVVNVAVSRFVREADAQAVEAFVSTKDVSGYERRLQGALESVRLRNKEYERDRELLAKWLAQRSS
jgi:puromycin-sensitive aminopeptidase